jgi:hypothetical protein
MKKSTKWTIGAIISGLLCAICFLLGLIYINYVLLLPTMLLFLGILFCLDRSLSNNVNTVFIPSQKEELKKEKTLLEELDEHFETVIPPTQEERKVFDNYMAERKGDINTYPPIVRQRSKMQNVAKLIAAGEAVGVIRHKPLEKNKEDMYKEKLEEAKDKMNKALLTGNGDAYQEYRQDVRKCENELLGAQEEIKAYNLAAEVSKNLEKQEEVQMMNEKVSTKKKSKKKQKAAPKKKKLPAQKKKAPKKGK